MERKLVVFLVLGLFAISVGQTAFIYYTSFTLVQDSYVTAKATSGQGIVSLCVNTPPTLGFECNSSTLRQSEFYTCTLNSSDAQNDALSFSFTSLSGYMGGTIDGNGVYAVTPTQNMTGNSTVEFRVEDDSNCNNSFTTINVSFNVTDTNDAPVYDVVIEGDDVEILKWDEGSTYRGVFLDDHFSDPDGDDLNYTYFSFSSEFTISILGTSEILISHSSCGTGSVIFQANDPYNLTADSGVITLEVDCADNAASSGGGGGGSFSSCETEWKCGDWQRCFKNNTQRRSCTDIYGCADPYERYFWQECTYVAHCNNGIMDIDEEGLDCGGDDCSVCETCTDNKLNNYEVEVDCGGPNCNACSNCYDGIQNYQESGLDCGGPICEPCPTCNDGIQNQNETAIDCGGPFCAPCTRIEAPTLVEDGGDQNKLNVVLVGSFLGLAVVAVAYKLFKSQIHALIAALLLAAALKRRKQILLTPEQKSFILSHLKDIEKKKLLDKNKLVIFQDLLGRLQRQFFSFLIDSAADTPLIFSRIDKLNKNKKVKELLKKQYLSLLKLEQKKGFSKLDLQLSIEFFRTIVYHVSKSNKKDITRTVTELVSYKKPQSDVIKQYLYNGMLALQFGKNATAREKYMKALELYQKLSQDEQAKVYDEIVLDFNHLVYASTFQ